MILQEKLQDLEQNDRDEILEFLQSKIEQGQSYGKPVQRISSRIRLYQGAASVQRDIQNQSNILNSVANNGEKHDIVRKYKS